MKNLVKFMFEEKEGFLSVVKIDTKVYTLAQKETPKVKHIKLTHELLISTDVKNPIYQLAHVHVIDQSEIIKKVYEALQADNNLYFKQLDDSLCALELFITLD